MSDLWPNGRCEMCGNSAHGGECYDEGEARSLVVGDPDACKGVRTNGGGEDSYNETGDPCSSCGQELLWDRDDRLTYCVNDWYHG